MRSLFLISFFVSIGLFFLVNPIFLSARLSTNIAPTSLTEFCHLAHLQIRQMHSSW
ncbi:hypothetical protein wVul_1190 [Wolbachia endosymbiont of Armadillidium vulgare str. wVulC]|nr:hypothetical protein wVul_1190 [Wolbachia endosymbiont of Armadillidium vulgare str. wVulC]